MTSKATPLSTEIVSTEANIINNVNDGNNNNNDGNNNSNNDNDNDENDNYNDKNVSVDHVVRILQKLRPRLIPLKIFSSLI